MPLKSISTSLNNDSRMQYSSLNGISDVCQAVLVHFMNSPQFTSSLLPNATIMPGLIFNMFGRIKASIRNAV